MVRKIFSEYTMCQKEVDIDLKYKFLFCVSYKVINIIIDYFIIINYLSQVNFGSLERRQRHLLKSESKCYPFVSVSPFCAASDFTEHLEEWPSQLYTYLWLFLGVLIGLLAKWKVVIPVWWDSKEINWDQPKFFYFDEIQMCFC